MSAITTHASSTASLVVPRAVIFDAYGTLFDVHSVVAAAEQLFPGDGQALSQLWRQKQIEYTQLRTLADPSGCHYTPFWDITIDALRYAAARLGLTDALTAAAEKRLMDEYACLSAFPDTLPTLKALRERFGVPLAILSNGNPPMLDIAVKSAGMTGLFDHVLSVDAVRAYKPAAAAYALGPQAFGTAAREMVFVSSNGWDIAGATWFGYTTFWLDRASLPLEELGVTPRAMGRGMSELVAFIEGGCAQQPIALSTHRAGPRKRPSSQKQ
ncbi:haloacid dehalogenase type II [Caballeronia sp. LZ062]|uniref:haloacid dehalogenase type II n=1 Tax=unclassified Caballeronia TaxID=2646786 RepID=UPI002857E6E0|nr:MULTISPECIES: haloacid dehalogenase type II [unclassified Caballeronia]MDR5854299.1 haloacid dehalogenase type II [Caballeronia sp. LZ050]MDR5871170.1 haloacid dehalogenase type II [Caballeronia sp. LZ062]